MRGIYIHIPFCRKICNYCDFYKMVVSDKFKDEYIDYLIKDLRLSVSLYNLDEVDTIYIGGGTPSCLMLESLKKLFDELSSLFDLRRLKEFTIEANPEDLTVDFIKLISEFHVSRISIGVQTFNNKCDSVLGRVTDYEKLSNSVKILNEYNLTNYSFDLIYAVPNTSLDDLEKDIQKLISLKPKHISTYSLILEERTILYHRYLNNEFFTIDESMDRKMYDYILDTLRKYDFNQYEISNYSLPGYESKHNLIYWNSDEYLGIGAGASSFWKNKRFTKIANIKKYYQKIDKKEEPVEEYEVLDNDRLMEDYLMLGLRKINGIDILDFFDKFKINIFEKFSKIQELITDGSLILENNLLKIHPDYIYISNYIIGKILFD